MTHSIRRDPAAVGPGRIRVWAIIVRGVVTNLCRPATDSVSIDGASAQIVTARGAGGGRFGGPRD